MNRANEIFGFEKIIKREIKKIKNSNGLNKETLLRYYEQSVAEGLSLGRVCKRISKMRMLSDMFGKKFEDSTKEDIVTLVRMIEEKNVSPWTKSDYKKILKKFYKWFKGDDEFYPPEVRWIKCGKKFPSKLMSKDLLTPEEGNSLKENASDVQDKALYSVLSDSGRRFGEIFGIGIEDVDFDSIGAVLRVDGKVGEDRARIGEKSAADLKKWLDRYHPNKNNPKSPVWVVVKNGQVKQMPYNYANNRLKQAAKRAGIKKKVWFKLFRHSRVTPAADHLTEEQFNQVFGWQPGSDARKYYLHLSGKQRDNAFLKMNGIETINNGHSQSSNGVQVKQCSKCKKSNSHDAKYCNECGLDFDLKFAMEMDQKKDALKEKIEMFLTKLEKSPETVDKFMKAVDMVK